MPSASEIPTTVTETVSESRAPHSKRDSVSRPNSSVPAQCAAPGLCRRCSKSIAAGLCGASHGAARPPSTKAASSTAPASASGCRRMRFRRFKVNGPINGKEYSDTPGKVGSNSDMAYLRAWFVTVGLAASLCIGSASAQRGPGQAQPAAAEQLFTLANQSRAQSGAGPLAWDSALAEAALKHCERMVAEGPIAHRYGGELDLTARTAAAGAHFSLIEENIAVGPYPATIHEGWLNSPPHRANLLNHEVDRVGIAVIAIQGALYAVADYARGVPVLTPSQVESTVAGLIRVSGIAVRKDPQDARAACLTDRGLPSDLVDGQPQFVMRWQGADLQHLP